MGNKRPMIKESVGAQYYAFNQPEEGKEFDSTKYSEVIKRETVKKASVTENGESTPVMASGKAYTTVSQSTSVDIATEVIAVDADDLAKMRGETVNESGLISSGAPTKRPFFAWGKTVLLDGGQKRFEWYPKCQLIENTDDIETKEESFKEQNDTITIRAYPFNEAGDIKNYVATEAANYPEGLTEELFFSKPIVTAADLTSVLTPGA